jgi:hypothetical protein
VSLIHPPPNRVKTNSLNLAFLMVTLSAALVPSYRQHQPDFSVLDLKAHFRARCYLTEPIKSLPDPPAADFISRLWQCLSALGSIRPPISSSKCCIIGEGIG